MSLFPRLSLPMGPAPKGRRAGPGSLRESARSPAGSNSLALWNDNGAEFRREKALLSLLCYPPKTKTDSEIRT